MSNVKYIGQKAVYHRKFLAEICKNLKGFGVGRIVYNEMDVSKYPEPCYYIIKEAEPHMATEENTRCRIKAERIFRGKNLGIVDVRLTHLPNWTLVGKSNEHRYLSADHTQPKVETVKNVYDYPPTLALYIKRKFLKDEFLPKMLIKPHEQLMEFKRVDEPTDEIKKVIFPPYDFVAKDGLMIHKPSEMPDSYHIKMARYPGLRWKVILKPKDSQSVSEKLGLDK